MRGLRLTSLRVAGFRGINSPIEFDFSAPLTLVFAPNGTGKTTMCEAAEWLLTGQVERLKEGRDFNASVLQSKFATEADEPSTSATLFVGDQKRYLSRLATGARSRTQFGESEASTAFYNARELLEVLAPAAAADEAHHLTANNLRQRWLKGTRFLSADALAALVDTDEATIERRTQVFADLLGIRHLLDAERQCDKYATGLAAKYRALSQQVSRQTTEADTLEQSLATTDNAQKIEISARSEANEAVALLDESDLVAPLSIDDMDSLLEALTAVHRRQRHGLDGRAEAAVHIQSRWGSRLELQRAVEQSSVVESSLSTQFADIRDRGSKAAAQLASHIADRDVASEEARALSAAKDQLAQSSAFLLSTLLDAGAIQEHPQSLGSLTAQYVESTWSVESREHRRRELEGLSMQLEQGAGQAERLRRIEADLTIAREQQVSEQALARLRAEAAAASARAQSAAALFDMTAEPATRLRAAAQDLLAHQDGLDTSKCPTCSHDWGDFDHLRSAIAATLTAAPEIMELARVTASSATEGANAARRQLDSALATNVHINDLEKERTLLAGAEYRLKLGLERLGLTQNATVEGVRAAIVRLGVADALAALLMARDGLSPSIVSGAPSILPDDAIVSDLRIHLDAAFSTRNQDIQVQLAKLTKDIDQATQERDQLRVSFAATQQSLRDCQEAKKQQSSELATMHAAWEFLAPGLEWTDDALTTIRATLTRDIERLTRVEGHIEAARAAWRAETKHIMLKQLREELRPLLDLQRRIGESIAAANRARAVFQSTYTTTSREQILSLSRVVNPLFSRMHANRLFDHINLGEDSDFLHWLAVAGGERLDPGKDFSQGQRQDLALALFLARARSLGGTFFLDEPVIHLDDLNRVGLLDVLRATVLENSQTLNLVITTSSRALARHIVEKFARVPPVETPTGRAHPLKVLELDGNGRSGVTLQTIYPSR
jgi:DNA repair exonuclease SbcCD ATPase subunit